MKIVFIVCLNVFALATFAQNNNDAALSASNPFSAASKLTFEAPPFNKITNEAYKPALEAGIKAQQEEVQKIASNPAAPTFENTFAALEKSGRLLSRVNHVFNLVTGANTNDTLQQLQEEMAPKLAASQDAIYLNDKLFKRIETVYQNREKLQLDAESKRLAEYQYQQFVLAGAKLSESDKAALKKLNEEDASLSAKYTNQLLNAAKNGALIISD